MSSQSGISLQVERPTRVRYLVIAFAAALAVITYIDRVSISFAAPFIRQDLHLTNVEIGWAFTAFGWAYALFEMPGGFLGDWLGPRKILMRIVIWWSVFTAATGWVWSFTSLVVTRFLFGMGEAGCFPNLTKAYSTWLPQRERPRAQGVMWLSTRWGAALTPPLVALVMTAVGWRHAFEIFGCLGVVWAVAFFLWYRDDPLQNKQMNEAERELVRSSAQLAKGNRDLPWGRFFRSRQAWLICGQYFSHSWAWYFYMTWLPSYMRDGRHLNFANTAVASAVPLFMAGLGDPTSVFLAGRLSNTMGLARARRAIALTGFTLGAALLLLSTTIADPTSAVLTIGLAAYSLELVMPIAWSTHDGRGRQIRRHRFGRHEYDGQYRRRAFSPGHRLHAGLDRQQLERHVLRFRPGPGAGDSLLGIS